jgi:nucleoside-diphosphate kinase
MATERTFIMLKPDATNRGLIGEVLARLERKGLKLAALRLLAVTPQQAATHYAVHEGKPFYEGLVRYIQSAPVVAAVVEGPGAVATVRKVVGATRPNEAEPGTIRGDFGLDVSNNLIHASDSVENAAVELAIYFAPEELVTYQRAIDPWLVGS